VPELDVPELWEDVHSQTGLDCFSGRLIERLGLQPLMGELLERDLASPGIDVPANHQICGNLIEPALGIGLSFERLGLFAIGGIPVPRSLLINGVCGGRFGAVGCSWWVFDRVGGGFEVVAVMARWEWRAVRLGVPIRRGCG
jgi:hypothetical protein